MGANAPLLAGAVGSVLFIVGAIVVTVLFLRESRNGIPFEGEIKTPFIAFKIRSGSSPEAEGRQEDPSGITKEDAGAPVEIRHVRRGSKP